MGHIHTESGQYDLTVSAYIIHQSPLAEPAVAQPRTPSDSPSDHSSPAMPSRMPAPHGTASAPRVLLHRHKTLGVLIQPGGHVELDETPWQSVAHEVLEETGYELDQLLVLQPHGALTHLTGDIVHPQPVVLRSFPFGDLPHFHTDLAFAFTTDQAPRNGVAAGESHEFNWLTREELRDLPDEQTYPDVKQVIDHIFGHVLTTWEPVPTSRYHLGAPQDQ